jgi:phage tail sheath protein FI
MAHGVTIQERPTNVNPPVEVSAGMIVAVGVAPINSVDLTNVNKPKLCNTLAEFEASFGALVDDHSEWTLHEVAKAAFRYFGIGPIICINVIDPEDADHTASVTDQSHQLVDGSVQLQVYGGPDEPLLGVLEESVVVKNLASVTKTLGVDYTLAFDDDGYLVVSTVDGGTIGENDVILVTFDYLDPSGVSTADVLGSAAGGTYTGLEVITRVPSALREIPGILIAPKYSQTPSVAARLQTLAAEIAGEFQAMAFLDLSTDTGDIADYTAAAAWKSDNGYTSKYAYALWPKGKISGEDDDPDLIFHLSTLFACAANVTDSEVNGVPYRSPSNKPVTLSAAVDDDGNEILLDKSQAQTLNDAGIATVINTMNGWRTWGNRTAAFPGTTDPKDSWVSVRRMFNWMANTVALTVADNVDEAGNRRLVDLVRNTVAIFIDSLIAQGALLDGSRIEFNQADNPVASLLSGTLTFRVPTTPPLPAENLVFAFEFDVENLSTLFG